MGRGGLPYMVNFHIWQIGRGGLPYMGNFHIWIYGKWHVTACQIRKWDVTACQAETDRHAIHPARVVAGAALRHFVRPVGWLPSSCRLAMYDGALWSVG